MRRAIVCTGDNCTGVTIHVCVSGSKDVRINGRSVCRRSDTLTMGETLTQGSNSVFVNGIGVARTGDVASCSFQVVSKNQSVFSK